MTSGKKILGVTVGVVALLVVGRVGLGFLRQPDDKTLIAEAIAEAQKASREGRPGGVLDFLSTSLLVNDTDASASRRDISQKIKDMKPDVKFDSVEPQFFEGEARIETTAKLSLSILNFSKDISFPNTVIKLKKEEEREWFIIPKKSWKITEIRVPLENLPSEFWGG